MTKLSSSALSAVWAGSVATMRPPLMTSVVRADAEPGAVAEDAAAGGGPAVDPDAVEAGEVLDAVALPGSAGQARMVPGDERVVQDDGVRGGTADGDRPALHRPFGDDEHGLAGVPGSGRAGAVASGVIEDRGAPRRCA